MYSFHCPRRTPVLILRSLGQGLARQCTGELTQKHRPLLFVQVLPPTRPRASATNTFSFKSQSACQPCATTYCLNCIRCGKGCPQPPISPASLPSVAPPQHPCESPGLRGTHRWWAGTISARSPPLLGPRGRRHPAGSRPSSCSHRRSRQSIRTVLPEQSHPESRKASPREKDVALEPAPARGGHSNTSVWGSTGVLTWM